METGKSKHIGRKILYTLVIAASVLIALLCLAGIVGGWALQNRAKNVTVAALQVIENAAANAHDALGQVDKPLALVQSKTSDFASASAQISQNVSDKGLIRTLLPEDKDQQLVATVDSLKTTYADVRGSITNALDMYRTIDRLPFINLPSLSTDQMDKIQNGMDKTQALADTLRTQVQDVRAGAAGAVDKVTATAGLLSTTTSDVRNRLANAQAKLAAMQALAKHLQQVVPAAFMTAALVLTLVLAFIIYTQVEVIRLFLARWRMLGEAPASAASAEGTAA